MKKTELVAKLSKAGVKVVNNKVKVKDAKAFLAKHVQASDADDDDGEVFIDFHNTKESVEDNMAELVAKLSEAGVKVVNGKVKVKDVKRIIQASAAMWALPFNYDNYASVFVIVSDETPGTEHGKFKPVTPLYQGGATLEQLINQTDKLEVSMRMSGKALIVSPRGFGNYADRTLGMQSFNDAWVFTSYDDFLKEASTWDKNK